MSVSHAYFYSVQIISSFQCSLPAVPDIITQDSERLLRIRFLIGNNVAWKGRKGKKKEELDFVQDGISDTIML